MQRHPTEPSKVQSMPPGDTCPEAAAQEEDGACRGRQALSETEEQGGQASLRPTEPGKGQGNMEEGARV